MASAFAGMGWHIPELLAQMPGAEDFYFDSISQIRLDRWSAGRVALIGDAGYAAGPGGNGTGTAVVAAYVLSCDEPAPPPTATTARRSPGTSSCCDALRGARPGLSRRRPEVLDPADRQADPGNRDRLLRMLPYLRPRPDRARLSTRTATAIRLPEYSGT